MTRKKFSQGIRQITARFRELTTALALSVFGVVAFSLQNTAHAQTSPTSIPKITVTPVSAPANVPRSIEISGIALSCGRPTQNLMLDTSLVSQTGNLLIRINAFVTLPPNLPPLLCDVLVPYRYTFAYTPSSDGVIRIVPVFEGGVILGGSRIATAKDAAAPRAALDITGAWYDPATNGTGFTFVHNASGSDLSFGTYYAYDAGGLPRWFVIDNLRWSADGLTVSGTIRSTEGQGQCAAGLMACPMQGVIVGESNQIQIVFEQGPTTTQFPPPPPNWLGKVTMRTAAGAPFYSATISRIGF